MISRSGGGWGPPAAAAAAPSSFSTSFAATENPISEGGAWDRAATSFKAVRTTGGIAYGEAFTDANDDSLARLVPSAFTAPLDNYEVICTVDRANPDLSSEIEILLRMTADASSYNCYEVLVSSSGGGEIVRIDGGGPGNFTEFNGAGGTPDTTFTIAGWTGTGDKIKARVTGTNPVRIQMWHAPASDPTTYTQKVDCDDSHASRKQTGQPGIGFYQTTVNAALLNAGWSDFTVTAV